MEQATSGLQESADRTKKILAVDTKQTSEPPTTTEAPTIHGNFDCRVVEVGNAKDVSTETDDSSHTLSLQQDLLGSRKECSALNDQVQQKDKDILKLQGDVSSSRTKTTAKERENALLQAKLTNLEREVQKLKDSAAVQPLNEHPTLLELRQIAKDQSRWNNLVVQNTDVEAIDVVIVNGPWWNRAYNYLIGKTNVSPGPVNLAPPSHNRADYNCVQDTFAEKLVSFFGICCGHIFKIFGKGHFPERIILLGYQAAESRVKAMTTKEKLWWFDVDDTFIKHSDDLGDAEPEVVYIKHGSPLSPRKTIRHYLENTGVRLDDFSTLLYCWEKQ